jgi:hypothetical protein
MRSMVDGYEAAHRTSRGSLNAPARPLRETFGAEAEVQDGRYVDAALTVL